MEELKHKFPLTLNDCYDLINTYSQLDPLKPNEIFTYDYVKLLDIWNSFLHTIAVIHETIRTSSEMSLNIQELIDKGYIK